MAQSEQKEQCKTDAGASSVKLADERYRLEKEKAMEKMKYEYAVLYGFRQSIKAKWIMCRNDRYARETEYINLETLEEWVEDYRLGRDGLYHSPEEIKEVKA